MNSPNRSVPNVHLRSCVPDPGIKGRDKRLHPTVFVGCNYLSLPWYLLPAHKSSFDGAPGRAECFHVQYKTDYCYTTWQTNSIAATWYLVLLGLLLHYNDVVMGAIPSQITSLTIVFSIVYSDADKKKASKLRITGLCAVNSPGTVEFPAQMASYAENVFIWWRHVTHLAIGCRL